MTEAGLLNAVADMLDIPPSRDGGSILLVATASAPPATALLSTADVVVLGTTVRAALYGSSSVVTRLCGAFTLVVPLENVVARVEVVEATATLRGQLAMIEGKISAVRPTAEPPWVSQLWFAARSPEDPRIPAFLDYWRQVRSWLVGDTDTPPEIPA